ncbi:MAG: AMP-dependent synthetase/ligase [Spirochaetota bacterium]
MQAPQAHETVPKRLHRVATTKPNAVALYSKDGGDAYVPLRFSELWSGVRTLGCAFLDLGVERGNHVGMMSDNRPEWIETDLALLSIGAIDVPRGSDSTADEMGYILAHADCRLVFAENTAQLEKILSQKERLAVLETIVVFDAGELEDGSARDGVTVRRFDALRDHGSRIVGERGPDFDAELERGTVDEVATLLYTSGTTGEPKGVMLTHRSFVFQIDRLRDVLFLDERDIFLSVLPIWHSFERAVEYIALERGCALAYSKPVGTVMLADMAEIRPTWMTSVPRIWEGVRSAVYRNVNKQSPVKRILFHFFVRIGEAHASLLNMFRGLLPQFTRRSRVVDIALSVVPLVALSPLKALGDVLVFKSLKERLGGRFVAGVSGGGALPPYVDRFFQAAGIKLLEGYGLTETGPVLAVRHQHHPVPGTVGRPLEDIEYRVLGEDMQVLPPGEKGVLYVKSPQIMEGYYKKPEETDAVLDDGWLNTGDIVVFTHSGEFTILGRAKETIVLLGGENIEPVPIEEKLTQSELIDQAMVVGQDQKFLGALIVPNEEALQAFLDEQGIQYVDREEALENPQVQERFRDEVNALVSTRTGFKAFERIFRFKLLPRHFEVGRELTHTLKIRRSVVYGLYDEQISSMFS